MTKRILALLWIGVLCLGLLLYNLPVSQSHFQPQATSTAPTQTAPEPPAPPQPHVRILNDDPSLQAAWEKIAADYTKATNIPVTVIPAGQAGEETPTLFTLHSEAELDQWKDLCLDFSGSAVYNQLASWDLTLRDDQKVCGIANNIDTFGLIVNTELLARAGYTLSQITSLAELRQKAGTIYTNQETLGFTAFASADLTGNMAAYLASIPDNFQAFLDLYINHSTCYPSELAEKTAADSLEDFRSGKAVFYLGGTKEYQQLTDMKLDILPIFRGTEDDARQCLCVAATSYWCVRNDAAPQDIQATLDFLAYLVTRDADGNVPVDQLQLLSPYRQATYSSNKLESHLRQDLVSGKEWLICDPVEELPEGYAEALLAYAAAPNGPNWDAVLAALNRTE